MAQPSSEFNRRASPLARRVLERFESGRHSRFPTADINKLALDPDHTSLLHGRVEMYLSGIAGYAASADRLNRRSRAELSKASRFLSQSFFEKYPDYADYRAKINGEATPELFRELEVAEQNRVDLIQEVDRLLAAPTPE